MAKAHKLIGVIENDETSCATFFPVHFTSSGDSSVKLMKDVKIEKEQVILLDDKYSIEAALGKNKNMEAFLFNRTA